MENTAERKKGTVVMFLAGTKNFGFIKPDNGGEDVFVHHSSILMDGYRTLNPGDRVSFEMGENHKGPCAVNVVVERKV